METLLCVALARSELRELRYVGDMGLSMEILVKMIYCEEGDGQFTLQLRALNHCVGCHIPNQDLLCSGE